MHRIRTFISIAVWLAAVSGSGATAQVPASGARDAGTVKAPEFEVASVGPSPTNQQEMNGFFTYPGGRIICKGCRLEYLIMVAYEAPDLHAHT
jgi:hypothetical protein